MIQADYLDLIKNKFDINQDLDLEKFLKVRSSTICRYRSGKAQFGPAVAMRIAEILKIDPNQVAGDMMAARAKDRKTRNKWLKCGILLPLMLTSIISPITQNVEAQQGYTTEYTLCAYVTR